MLLLTKKCYHLLVQHAITCSENLWLLGPYESYSLHSCRIIYQSLAYLLVLEDKRPAPARRGMRNHILPPRTITITCIGPRIKQQRNHTRTSFFQQVQVSPALQPAPSVSATSITRSTSMHLSSSGTNEPKHTVSAMQVGIWSI